MEIEEESIDIRRYVGIFLSYWWLMLLVPASGGVLGYLYSANQEKVYEARASLLVQQRRVGLEPGVSDFSVSQELAATYSRQVSPNPPKDTDGRREDSGRGWVRELQGRWPGVLG